MREQSLTQRIWRRLFRRQAALPPPERGPSLPEVAQAILDHIRGQTYLEIGVCSGDSLRPIRAAKKIGVDPHFQLPAFNKNLGQLFEMTSDEFFSKHDSLFSTQKIDVAVVDGLHTYEQALKDVQNCLRHLTAKGIVVMHDCNPTTEAMAALSQEEAVRMSGSPFWCGDVWKAVVHLRALHNDLQVFVLDCHFGIGIVTRGTPESRCNFSAKQIQRLSYADLASNRQHLLNLKNPDYLQRFLIDHRGK